MTPDENLRCKNDEGQANGKYVNKSIQILTE